ncbi:hypothetical protein [Maribacter sp. MAR_2009_72]|uniref:hypothetical protein n=1 Tax=Maribacter sp. MAR_2009_72 TaxID=1250050 RepID=UPI00119A3A27|nr:hypothetical protein [Maribacter sp. MAR_2009_72]TVZ16460.1 hypothetical protein JM81_2721 [Maribacter sp. MAR_2009_72]
MNSTYSFIKVCRNGALKKPLYTFNVHTIFTKGTKYRFFALFLLYFVQVGMYAQEEEVINHKGTRVLVRNTVVTTSATAPTGPLLNDIWFDTSAEVTKIYDGTSWLTINLDALNKKENSENKSTDSSLSDATNTKFPTELAVKTYVDNEIAAVGDDDITGVSFDGTDLTVAEGATNFSADLSSLEESADITANTTLINNHITADNDLSATNELQDANEISIDDSLNNFTATNVEDALAELASGTATNLYTDDGSLSGNRAVTQNNFDLNFDANTLVISGNDNRVGIGTDSPIQEMDVSGRINITNGVIQKGGTAITTTNDLGLYSNISGDAIRVATNNAPINFYSDLNGSGSTGGTANLSINANGNVGVGVATATSKMDINGDLRVRSLGPGSNTDNIVITDSDGNLGQLPITDLETQTTISQNNTTGVITHNSENGATQTVNVISTNANNSISTGTDGGAYFNNPIKAYGTLIPSTNSIMSIGISSAVKNGVGRYTFTMSTTRSTANYPIQLSVFESGTRDINIFVTSQTTTTFSIAIIEEIGGAFPSDNYIDRTCYFNIMDF